MSGWILSKNEKYIFVCAVGIGFEYNYHTGHTVGGTKNRGNDKSDIDD